MTLLIVLLVAVLQSLATLALYGWGVLRAFGLSGTKAEIVFLLPSVIALAVNSLVIFASPLFRPQRAGTRLALVLGCATVSTLVAFAAAMIAGLNKWSS